MLVVAVKTTGFPLWWLPIVLTFFLIIVITIVLCVSYSAYRNKGEDYEGIVTHSLIYVYC